MTFTLRVIVIAPCSDQALEEAEAVRRADVAVDAQLAVLVEVLRGGLAGGELGEVRVREGEGGLRGAALAGDDDGLGAREVDGPRRVGSGHLEDEDRLHL